MTQSAHPRTLSRDFKHVKRSVPGAAPALNAWTGFGAGLAAGLLVALGVFLSMRDPAPAEPQPAADARPASAKAAETAAEAAPPAVVDPAKDYTFYNMLPEQEVEVPAGTDAKSGRPAMPKGDVVLQAGAFKQPAEAEKLQARLAQYGVDAKIQRFSLDDETWYRVRIGPIATVEELEAVRTKLAEAEVEAAPVSSVVETPPP